MLLLRFALVVGIVSSALSLIVAPAAAQPAPLCDVNCGPDPGSGGYETTLQARPRPLNGRGFSSVFATPARGDAPPRATEDAAVLPGSESYDYVVPILSLPGRNGLDLNLALYQNSRVWTIDAVSGVATFNADRDFPSYGFRIGFGFIEGPYDNGGGSLSFALTEPDGSKRELKASVGSIYASVDSSYIDFNSATKILRRKDGSQWHYQQVGFTTIYRPTKIQDTNGNYISITYRSDAGFSQQSINTITDTVGRIVTFNYDTAGRLLSITQGSKTHASFSWNTAYILKYSFSLTVANSPANNSTHNVLTGCTYGNGTGYNFVYGDWGIVTRIEQKSANGTVRSHVSYNYPPATTALAAHPTFTQRAVFDGFNTATWTYSVTKSAGQVSSYAITAPNGTVTTTNLFTTGPETGLVSSVVVTSGASTLRTTTNTWIQDAGGPLISSVVNSLENGAQSKVEFSYAANGNVSEVREYDYGLVLKRKAQTDYLSDLNYTDRHILDRPVQVRVYDGAGSLKARTDIAYDAAVTSETGVTNHDDINYGSGLLYRGNVTSITRYENAPAGTGTVMRSFTYDTLGNLRTAQLNCCQQRQWTFTSATQFAYPETITSGPVGTQLSTSRTYDLASGRVLTASDENQKTTTFIYDSVGRVTNVQRPDGVEVTTAYEDYAALPMVTTTTPIEPGKSLVSVTTFDGLGRAIKQEIKDAGATTHSIAETQYDSMGRPFKASNPYAPGHTPIWSESQFDPLSRVTKIIPPDGSAAANHSLISYAGNQVTVTDPAGKQRRSITDALGRLIEVHEPGGGSEATSGSGSATVSGSLQVTGGTSATSGTGSATVNGSLQSIAGTSGTPGTGAATVNGSLQTIPPNPTRGTGSVTISGSVQSWTADPCADEIPPAGEPPQSCPFTWYDEGTVSITVNGFTATVGFGQGSTSATIANGLAQIFNTNGSSPVTASVSSTTVNLSAKATGASTNYPLSVSWTSVSFTTTKSGNTLTGGSDGTTIYDSGSAWVTVNGFQASASYGQGSTSASVANAIANVLNTNGASPVTASVSGSTISLTAKTSGASTNYSLSSGSSTSQSGTFSQPSFTVSVSGSNLTGGTNSTPTVYDSGSVWVTVNGAQKSTGYGQGSTSTSVATALRDAINADGSYPVSASLSGATLSLTAKSAGASTNYSLSAGSSTSQPGSFSLPSFSVSVSGSTLTGGVDGTAPVTDSGSVWVAVNGFQATVSYGPGSTTTSVASALASAFNSNPASSVTASASASNITLTARAAGASTNYAVSSGSSTSNPGTFSQPSFSVSASALSGGSDGTAPSLAAPHVTSYAYNVLDALTQVTQGAQSRTYSYDDLGRLTSATTPEAGTVNYQYNAFDLVTRRFDARGVVTDYGYDGLNRLTSVSYNVGATGVPATPGVTYTYGTSVATNTSGRLVSVSDGVGSEAYTYDTLGRITQLQKAINSVNYNTSYQYNLAGELISLTYPSGRVVAQSYDVIGRLSQIQSGGVNYLASASYNAAGQPTAVTYGNGVQAAVGYNARLQLASLSYTKQTSKLLELAYSYAAPNGGNNGQITGITDTTGTAEAGRTVNYTYDAWLRLKTAVTTGSSAYPQWGLSWSYDRYGNRTEQRVTHGSGPSNAVAVDAATNRLLGYSYDANGNMTHDGLNSLVYDAENRVLSSTTGGVTTNYTYDGAGLRVKKISGGTTTVYIFSGGKVIAEYVNGAAVNSPTREYMYSGSQLLATLEAGTAKYHHADHLSVRATTDAAGTKIGEQAHYPFGEAWFSASTTAKQRFTTYERDTESGNDYAIFRYHVNRLGRFNRPDPLAGYIADPQSLNRYGYVLNDPANMVDPNGLDAFSLFENTSPLLNDGSFAGGGGGGSQCYVDGVRTTCSSGYGLVENGHAAVLPPGVSPTGFLGGHHYEIRFTDDGLEFAYPGLTAAQIEALGLPLRLQAGTSEGGRLPLDDIRKQLLEIVRSRPDCAFLFGGLKAAENVISKISNIFNVNSANWVANSPEKRRAAQMISDRSLFGVTIGGPSRDGTWNASWFNVYLGGPFDSYSPSGQLTAIFHEIIHVPHFGNRNFTIGHDLISRYGANHHIATRCGTEHTKPR